MELVSVPYEVKPDLYRSTAPLRSGAPTPELRALKAAEFSGPLRGDLLGQCGDCQEGLALLSRDLGVDGASLEVLAMECTEDLALLHDGVLKAIAFAFPSGFRPTAKLDLNFAQVHAPVADGEALRAASAGITMAMKRPGAHFERGVWTLTTRPELSQHPDLDRPEARHADDLWFRREFQVLKALGGGWTGFSVHVAMTPWRTLSNSMQDRLKASVRSMRSETLAYKNLRQISHLLK